jgi:uncharacterized protein
MLLTHKKSREFTPREISDATRVTEVLTALSFESRDEVDRIMNKAMKAGGSETRPAEDHGFMYGRSFNDPDGHIWEAFWMDPAAVNQGGE